MSSHINIQRSYLYTETGATARAGRRYGIRLFEPPSVGQCRQLAIQQRREPGG